MAKGKILAICHSGGEFVTNNDGSMSYFGGEAHAIEINHKMHLRDLKLEISNMFCCNSDTISIKYFLPNNKTTLITVSNDKDLQRMVDFNAGSTTTDVYVLKMVETRATRTRSATFDSLTPTEGTIATLVTQEDPKRQKVCTDWGNLISGEGQIFDGPRAFRDALHNYAIANNFVYRFIKNDASRVTAECTAEACPWRIHASRSSANQEFVIKTINNNHTCQRDISKEGHRLASQRWIASVIKDKLRDSPNYKPREIADDLQRDYGLGLNYAQAWRGRFLAKKELHNSHEESCNQLPWFLDRILETNPGSMATLRTSDDSRFPLFLAFRASISGFEHGCRPLLFLDGVPLKANKKWTLLVATGVDAESNIFPVAISVAEAETIENWHWFLVQLRSALSMSNTITFVSTEESGLEEAVLQVFEDSYYGYSVDHLIEAFKAQLEESWTEDLKDTMVDSFKQSISAGKADEFNECIERIKTESKELAEWVLSRKPVYWSDAFFKGLRYGHYSSKAVETFNSWLSTRYEPSVVQMIDMLRCKIMEMMYTRRESLNSWTEILTPSVSQRMQEEITKARNLNVVCSTGSVFEVCDGSTNVVNTETWECTCRKWQVTGLPCVHALAVFERTDGCMYDYCSKYFSTDLYRLTYSVSINPIPDGGWPVCNHPSHSTLASSPRTRRLAGRPKVRPSDPRITAKRPVRCSRCKGHGHNKQTCKAPS